MSEVWLGLGSNLGDKRAYLVQALELIGKECRVVDVSSFYKTEPVGFKDQDWFLNCAAKIETSRSPRQLLELFKSIERQLGRTQRVKDGPRVIDIDILLYGGSTFEEERLMIPHPRMHERRFVLAPLREIAADVVHPRLGQTIAELADALPQEEGVELCEVRSEGVKPWA